MLFRSTLDAPAIGLVGHSFGGVVALATAARRPDLVDGLVIYESPMSWEPWWSQNSGGSQALRSADEPEQAAETFMRRFLGDMRWERLPESTRHRRRREGVVLVQELASLRLGRPYDFTDLRCPVVVGCGSRAAEHMRKGSELLANECSFTPLVVLDGAHHNAHRAEPDRFADLLVRPLLRRMEQEIG